MVTTFAMGNPVGMTVKAGTASSKTSGSTLTVDTSPLAVLNWSSFNIQKGETTSFVQPSDHSVVFNIIGDANPSQIFGDLKANGTVVLANAHGFYFGPNSMISVGGNFLATTAALPPDFGIGSSWQFSGMPPLAGIVNYGQIATGQGHSLYLIAENLNNQGTLTAPGGNIGLYAGREILVSDRADGRGLSATVKLPSGSVDNSGQMVADAGTIALQAQVVNQNGLIQANSVRKVNGVIELVASDQLNLGANSQIAAQGDNVSPDSPGGKVILKSGGSFSDAPGSKIATTGGALGGDGGNVEISAPNILSLDSSMDAGAQAGFARGQLLLDPANITLGTSGTGSAGDGTVAPGSGSGTLTLDVNTAFANMNFSQITLAATANITLAQSTTWNLSQSTGQTTGLLTLEAGGNIIFSKSAHITDANDWSIVLEAGVNFSTGAVQSGVGSIYLNGGSGLALNGSVQTSAGSISMTAGQDIQVGTGNIFTTGGGNINLQALAGDINAGTGTGGYQFSIFGYSVVASPGGIATAGGGNVTLTAGNNIISTPTVPAGQPTGASGAYGSQPGNVTLMAGNEILGDYTLANGVGTILAGVQVQNGKVTQVLDAGANVGSSTGPVSLSLISGSWNAWAANDIYIAEVRNPNGTFNGNALSVPAGEFVGDTGNPTVPARSQFLFDYAANAAANFWAGNAITLTGENLPRVNGENAGMPPVYPPVLTLEAGAGGISIANPIILYPSSQGALQITTTGGGDLTGANQQGTLVGITMSGSGLPGYADFAQGQASTPLHLHDANPVSVDVSGDINTFNLTVPTFAEISVAGNTDNFGFNGQNLSSSQTTSITVANAINYDGVVQEEGGLTLAGPGKFDIAAQSMNLGVSGGVSVQEQNAAVAAISPYGASLNISVPGNLEMTASQIANQALDGAVRVTVGGTLDVGGQQTAIGDPNAPKGIYTTSGGNISITASGDVNIDSSRIAAYDGGNIDIVSTTGDVNAGTGGVGYISMQGVELDAKTGQLISVPAIIAGSGILATTLPGSDGVLGNITVETPEGSINASAGGIIQIALNGANPPGAFINLNAGKDINAGDSGIIGGNLDLTAVGKINGILVGTGTINVLSQSSVNVTAFGGGAVNISASGTISGTVISGGNVSVSGETITASLIAQSVSSSGNVTSTSVGVPASNVAKEDSKAAEDAGTALANTDDSGSSDDDKKKKAKPITLAQKTGRVTVILPVKK